jgi:transposase
LARSDAEPSFSIGFVPIDPNALPQDAAALQEIVRTLLLEHGELHAENDKLRLLVQRFVRHQFGRRSEQLSPDQLQLGLEDLEQTIAANQAGQDAIAGVTRKPRSEPAARNHGALPAHLPRYEVVMDVEDRDCPCCGRALVPVGEISTEQLDIVPAQLRVRVTRRPRYVCRGCEEAVVVAPAPERPVDGGMPTEALIAHIVVSKFADALPLHRQAQMLARQGLTLDRSTQANWVGRAELAKVPLAQRVECQRRAAGGCSRCMSCWSARCCRRRRCSPTTPRCRCSSPVAGGPRPGSCGATPSMTAPGRDRAILWRPMSTPRTARPSARRDTSPGLKACCRSMGMPGSSAWRATGRMGR